MNPKANIDFRERPRRRRSAVLVAVLFGAGLLLAACGGAGGPNVAGAGTTSSTTDPSANGGSGYPTGNSAKDAAERQAKLLKLSQCMRAHGISDFPDPSNGGIQLHGGPNGDLNPNSPAFRAAQKACKKYTPFGDMTPAQKAAANGRAVKYARCMQNHGLPDFPEPNGQGIIEVNGNTPGLDPGSSQFQRAQRACKRYDNGFGMEVRMTHAGSGTNSNRAASPGGKS